MPAQAFPPTGGGGAAISASVPASCASVALAFALAFGFLPVNSESASDQIDAKACHEIVGSYH